MIEAQKGGDETGEIQDWLVISPKEREAARIWMEADEEKNQAIRSVEIETNAKGEC